LDKLKKGLKSPDFLRLMMKFPNPKQIILKDENDYTALLSYLACTVFQNRLLTRIFRPRREEVTGGWRKQCNE
jgi:hypothetical protein